MMILRILLGVACLSLFNTSQAEAQLLRRLRILPQVQSRFQPQQQPQRYVPQTVAPQNGYQGRLTASQPQSAYVRRPDGLVGRYAAQQPTQVQRVQVPTQVQRVQVPTQVQRVQVPTQVQRVQVPTQVQRVQVPTQIQRFPTARLSPAQTQAVATTNRQLRPNVVQGQLIPVRPTTQIPRQFGNAYLRLPAVAPVGISVLNQTRLQAQQLQAQQLQAQQLQAQQLQAQQLQAQQTQAQQLQAQQLQAQQTQAQQTQAQQTQAQQLQTLNNSILPAIEMPEAIVSLGEPASSIPISSAPTNPAPRGLSLSLDDDDLVPASAEVEVEPATEAEAVLDSNGKKTFSVLETIE